MPKSLLRILLAASAVSLSATAMAALPSQRIGVVDDTPAVIYAVGTLSGNSGVYTLPSTGEYAPVKLSQGVITQYYFQNSGATFMTTERLCGTAETSYGSVFAAMATSAGNGEDGAWSPSWWNYRNAQNQAYTYEIVATDMAYDAVSGNVYGWFKADSYGINWHLGIYDPDKATVTPVSADTSTQITALAFDADGHLWGIAGYTGTLYTISKSDGSLTEAGQLGVKATGTGQSAAIDPATGTLYWGAVESAMSASLQKVDLANCTATRVYDFPMGQRFSGFYIPAPAASNSAPAAVDDLRCTFTGHDCDMTVEFTAPATTFGGAELSGTLTYTLSLDDLAIATGQTEPGQPVSLTMAMAPGAHTLTLELSNRAGSSPKSAIDIFVGFDTPVSLVAPEAMLSEGREITVAWTAPACRNGGIADPALTRYRVVRLTDGAVVAADTDQLSVTDCPEQVQAAEYSYQVTVVYDDNDACSAMSNSVMAGEPYTVPYIQDFTSAPNLASIAFKAIDNLPGSPSWQLNGDTGSRRVSVEGVYGTVHSDFLFGAPIQLNEGVEYTLTLGMAASRANENTQLRIFLSRSQSTEQSAWVTPYLAPNYNFSVGDHTVGQLVEREFKFTVEADGVYYPAIYDFSLMYSTNQLSLGLVKITSDEQSIAVDPIGDGAVSVMAAGHTLTVSAPTPVAVIVADLAGRIVATGTAAPLLSVELPAGVYVVTAGNKTSKIAL